jgi:hypothetical protein
MLACTVSGSDEEGAAYLAWLEKRTLNLMRAPGFWPAVEALAEALVVRRSLSARAAKVVIDKAIEAFEAEFRATLVARRATAAVDGCVP